MIRHLAALALILAMTAPALISCSEEAASEQGPGDSAKPNGSEQSQGAEAKGAQDKKQRATQTQASVPQIEDEIAARIKKEGVGKRFVIGTIKPRGKGSPSRLTLTETPTAPDSFSMNTTENPGDTFPYFLGSGAYIEGPGSIHRFAGKVRYKGHTFNGEGDEQNRLTFLLTNEGYIYLRGKGLVTLADGEEVKLGH
ncbi:MAG TPA: hypothetical protein VNE39_16515 [Planctomycetota bacterium]|nr:hypothetical protein [Planctomycetota bacterium]